MSGASRAALINLTPVRFPREIQVERKAAICSDMED